MSDTNPNENYCEGIVDIQQYTLDLLKQICPAMEELRMVSTADRLIARATKIVEKRDTIRQAKLETLRENKSQPNEKTNIVESVGDVAKHSFVPNSRFTNVHRINKCTSKEYIEEMVSINHGKRGLAGEQEGGILKKARVDKGLLNKIYPNNPRMGDRVETGVAIQHGSFVRDPKFKSMNGVNNYCNQGYMGRGRGFDAASVGHWNTNVSTSFYRRHEYSFDVRYIEVPVDHFTIQNRNFRLRYLVNGHYHVKGGPVFLYTGNEGNIFMFAQNTGFMFDIAPVFNALVVFIEHRYYGESLPFGNLSMTQENLRFLSTSQALADYVYVIEDLRNKYFGTVLSKDTLPIIAFGGSYGGMLAAWLRMKYPTSVIGAIASSAPIWYFQDMVPCEKFYEIVTSVFEKFGTARCCNMIKSSWEILRNVTKSSAGRKYLYQTWKICDTFDNATDVEKLIDWLSDIYVNMAMTNYQYPTDFIVPLPAYPVKIFCDKLISLNSTDTKSTLDNLGKALSIYTNYSGSTVCNSINSTSKHLGEYTWDYQACTELVMPMCSTEKDMFETQPWDYKKYSEECFKKYGVRNNVPDWIVLQYGGKNLKYFSNIVFSNGMMDPWSCGGVSTNISSNIWAVNIIDGVHHSDLRGADAADTNYVIEARKFHEIAIKKWLNMS